MALGDIAKTGDHRKILEAMRDLLAQEMETASSMVVAQIAGRLQDIVRELDQMPLGEEASPSDELQAKRDARRAAAQSRHPSAGSNL